MFFYGWRKGERGTHTQKHTHTQIERETPALGLLVNKLVHSVEPHPGVRPISASARTGNNLKDVLPESLGHQKARAVGCFT